MSSETAPEEEDKNLSVCVLCLADLKEKSPKLLSCLHTLCEKCLNSLFQVQQKEEKSTDNELKSENENNSAEDLKINCPACDTAIEKSTVLDNLFINVDPAIVIEDDEESKEEEAICTACDEKAKETSFCLECREWLCDQCVQAHRRVRITKDHNIVPKETVQKELKEDDPPKSSKSMLCNIHKNEPLKLFCQTCDMLTCRDCQLLNHKDHKYQFMTEAITVQREILQDAVVKLKQKLNNYHQADKILISKNSELKSKLCDVCENIRKVSETLIQEITSHSDKLVTHLEKYINSKTNVISEKQRLVADAVLKMQHAIDFVENALTVGDDLSILYTKGLMMKTLKVLANAGIPFHPSILNYSVTYEHEKEVLMRNIWKVGHLMVDGNQYPPLPAGAAATTVARTPPTTAAPQQSQQKVNAGNRPVVNMQRLQEQLRQYPVEQRKAMAEKFYQRMVTHNQSQAQQPASLHPPAAHNRMGPTVFPNQQPMNNQMAGHSAAHNLYSLANGQVHNIGPNHQLNPGGNKYSSPIQQLMETTATHFPPNRGNHGNLNQASRQNLAHRPPAGIPGMQQRPVNTMHYHPASMRELSNKSPLTNSQQLGPTNRYQINQTNVMFESNRSPGAQAAAHANKTPSPAGAGFDQSNTGTASAPTSYAQFNLQGPNSASTQYVSSENKIKDETRFSSCAFAASRQETVKVPTPPPLVHNKDLQVQNTEQEKRDSPITAPQKTLETGKGIREPQEDDPNEDYCAVCQNGGDLLCCDNCPKVFHLKCHIPELNNFLSGDWRCTLCAETNDLVINEIHKDLFIPGTNKRKAPTGLTDKEIKVCERILLELYCHDRSPPFHEPVSKAVPNYHKIITNPMDFSKIKSKLQRQNFNHYNRIEDFLSDMKLVFKNCATYNSAYSDVGVAGKMLEENFEKLVQKFLPCYFDILDECERNTETPLSDGSESSIDKARNKKKKVSEETEQPPDL